MAAPTSAARDRGQQAYRKLRKLIVHGRLAPGSRLIETEIAERLSLNRTPVRSALQRLMQEGYISDPGKGRQSRPFVAPLTRDDAEELFHIVGELEGLAVWRAGRLAHRRRLVNKLNRLNDKLRDEIAGAAPSKERLHTVDTQFHRCYVEGGAGPRLLALHDAIKPQAERYTRLYVDALIDQIELSIDEHQSTIDAIEAGDANRAQLAVQTNWRNAAERLGHVIERAGELGSW
ncbi:MAG: GntR family transcriptional regulator [Gemmatimonadetes bacterium]|nr:GntR family transcriptional regulator [Gemmatimonadota bacterium]MYB99427.1 GntR family transcriptional regulator [Gemmatimonadota bacterium]MYI47179.1 GntR family transcriptional regulator [Gemmatimonadota bacterium]